MFSQIAYFLLFIGIGLGLIIYTEPVKRFTGSFDFAEKYFGMGGTYNFYKLLGLLILIGDLLWITGTLDRIIPDFLTQ